MAKDFYVVRAIKTFKTETSNFEAGKVYSVWGPKAKEHIKEGLLEEIDLEELEDTDGEDVENVSAPAGPAWSDADLGTFHFDDFGWVIHLSLPAFDVYTAGARKSKKNRQYPLTITAISDEELPEPEAITLVKKVIANQAALATRAAEGLWADFTGAGPESGMYWHGDLNQVAEGLDSGEAPRSAKDLYQLMKLDNLCVQKAGNAQSYAAELNFDAAFEEEHGVGILTDGEAVIGLGYNADVEPFKSRA